MMWAPTIASLTATLYPYTMLFRCQGFVRGRDVPPVPRRLLRPGARHRGAGARAGPRSAPLRDPPGGPRVLRAVCAAGADLAHGQRGAGPLPARPRQHAGPRGTMVGPPVPQPGRRLPRRTRDADSVGSETRPVGKEGVRTWVTRGYP